MLCDICNKNQATVHLTEIVDNQMTELHLCEECAREKSAAMEQQFGLSDLLAGMVELEKPQKEKEATSAASLKCPYCGLAYSDFKKIGRLGCGQCYDAFKPYLVQLIKKIHGSNVHHGKSPVQTGAKVTDKKIDTQDLRERLQKAIESEAFEEAARLRDQIKELEKKQSCSEHRVPNTEQREPGAKQ